MKILQYSDIHIHPHKNEHQRLDDCLRAQEWVCRTALERDIHDIIFLGDLFQDRQKIQVLAYQRTFELFQKYAHPDRLRFHLLLGNHDLWFSDRWEVSSVLPLKAIAGIQVIAEPCTLELGGRPFDWLPFVKNPLEVIDKCFRDRKGHVLCGHIALNGCSHNSFRHVSDVSVEYEGDVVQVGGNYFSEWDRVFLGHYHAAQQLTDTIEYLGSPLQLNFSEANQVKHIAILDTETLALEYIENNFSPRHIIVNIEELDQVDVRDNYVWIVGDPSQIDVCEIKRSLPKDSRKLEFRAKKLKVQIDDDSKKINTQFDLSDGKMLDKYVATIGAGRLDREKLIRIGHSICENS